MGCLLSKKSNFSPQSGLDELKQANVYAAGGNVGKAARQSMSGKLVGQEVESAKVVALRGADGGGEKVVAREGAKNGGMNATQRLVLKRIGGEELVDGWPKWLVDNVPREVFAGLVPRSADSYDMLAKVGQGTYSNVYKARDRETRKLVALKKVRFDTSEPESIKFMAREIMILQKLDHPNIIKLEGIATSRMQYSLYLVFKFMQSDLSRIVSRRDEKLTEPQVGASS